jgi:hypothetical protein
MTPVVYLGDDTPGVIPIEETTVNPSEEYPEAGDDDEPPLLEQCRDEDNSDDE